MKEIIKKIPLILLAGCMSFVITSAFAFAIAWSFEIHCTWRMVFGVWLLLIYAKLLIGKDGEE